VTERLEIIQVTDNKNVFLFATSGPQSLRPGGRDAGRNLAVSLNEKIDEDLKTAIRTKNGIRNS
jgi:hypothetical protein